MPRPVNPQLYQDILDALDHREGRTKHEVARRAEVPWRVAYKRLLKLLAQEKVWRTAAPTWHGGYEHVYYRVTPNPHGVAPLFPSNTGHSAEALAQCLGGYSFPQRGRM